MDFDIGIILDAFFVSKRAFARHFDASSSILC